MSGLAQQRCLHHVNREAVARCLGCQEFFCRECITEHEGRILCARCLQKSTATESAASKENRWVAKTASWAKASLGLGIAWMAFYLLGYFLLHIPSQFQHPFERVRDMMEDAGE